MGLFSKPKRDDTDELCKILEGVAQLDRAWDEDPARVIAHFLANVDDPLLMLARALVMLTAEGVLTPEGLATLGIDREELERIVSILSTDAPAENLRYQMEVQKAIDEYDAQIDEIIAGAGISVDAEKRGEIRSTIAKFAHENELTDLKIAYRLMKAEGSDPLKGLPGPTHPQGYL